MYELYVVCRRRPPAPPGGFKALSGEPRVDEVVVDGYWSTRGAGYLGGEPSAVFRVYRTDAGSEPVMTALAKAIADAGEGVVLSRVPVTMPWQFDLEHEGVDPPADWAALVARATHYRDEARRKSEEARRKLAEQKARWEAGLTPSALKEMDFTDVLRIISDDKK